jgi:1,4-alpha-glucan branching enzyme
VRDLNTQYRAFPALHAGDCRPESFAWVDAADADGRTLSFLRRWGDEQVLIVANFTPEPRPNHRAGVPTAGTWHEILNGDAIIYGGSGQGNLGGVQTNPVPAHGQPQSINLVLPPLALIALKAGKVLSGE